MSIEERPALSTDLESALGRLESALHEAASAAAVLRELAPRVGAIDTLVRQIEVALSDNRGAVPPAQPASPAQTSYSRPTLVVSPPAPAPPHEPLPTEAAVAQPAPIEAPGAAVGPSGPVIETPRRMIDVAADGAPAAKPVPQIQATADGEALSSFRLEFESPAAPLDLRAVDEAVSEHPAVRDVALVDYDGRKATLKVWITASARPTDVQDALRERASQLFPADAEVKVLALDGVA